MADGDAAAPAVAPAINRVPTVVRDHLEPLPFTGTANLDRWTPGPGIQLATIPANEGDGLEIRYDLEGRNTATAEYAWPRPANAPERLRFWLDTPGSGWGRVLEIDAHHEPTDRWRHQATIDLEPWPSAFSPSWRQIEVGAQNPFYRFHPTIDRLRFRLRRVHPEAPLTGTIVIGPVSGVRPRLVDGELPPPTDVRAPVFTTWGGAHQPHLEVGAAFGLTLHQAPVGFPNAGRTPAEVTRYAGQVARWTEAMDVAAALVFYGGPNQDWIDAHSHLAVRNARGEAYTRLGGMHLSPWHPGSLEFWRGHITRSLAQLRQAGLLEKFDTIKLYAGEESEISYEWSHVWAYDEHALKAYRAYLRAFYDNDLAALNRDWGSKHDAFENICPPSEYRPVRECWVFIDFYRLSMLRWCVALADVVGREYQPRHWLWLTHSLGTYPKRFYAARYPLFYTENLRRLGLIDYAQLSVLDWQGVEDVQLMRRMGVRVIGETDIVPSDERLRHLFAQCEKFRTDGVFLGILEHFSEDGRLTPKGELCRSLIEAFRKQYRADKK